MPHHVDFSYLLSSLSLEKEGNSQVMLCRLQELEAVYLDVSSVVADCILQGADIVAAKVKEDYRLQMICR